MDELNRKAIRDINNNRINDQSPIGETLSKLGATPESLGITSRETYRVLCESICDEAIEFVRKLDANGTVTCRYAAIERICELRLGLPVKQF